MAGIDEEAVMEMVAVERRAVAVDGQRVAARKIDPKSRS